jgi:hypothetical protein
MRRGGTAPEATIEMRARAAATASLKALGIDGVQPLPFQVPTRRQVDLRYCFVPRTVKECYLYAILNRDSDAQVAAPPVHRPLHVVWCLARCTGLTGACCCLLGFVFMHCTVAAVLNRHADVRARMARAQRNLMPLGLSCLSRDSPRLARAADIGRSRRSGP